MTQWSMTDGTQEINLNPEGRGIKEVSMTVPASCTESPGCATGRGTQAKPSTL